MCTAKLSPDELRALVFEWHAGQLDAAGNPYTEHLDAVANRFPKDSDEYRVGLLHDCMEDQGITVEMLRRIGESERVIASTVAMTHLKGEPNVVYYARVKADELARKVKKSDIMHNMDPNRLYYLPEERRWRMLRKYHKGLLTLLF